MKALTLGALLLICPGVLAAETRSIKVTAKSEIKVAPNEVVLELAVHTRDKVLLNAKRTRTPVGLLFAGGGGITFGNKIGHVLRALDIRLFT